MQDADPDENYLWIDNRVMIVLDKTAAVFWKHIIDGMWLFQQGEGDETPKVREYVLTKMKKEFPRVNIKRIEQDLDKNYGIVLGVAETGCPVDAGLKVKEVSVKNLAAPMRMDLALTYKCNLNCGKCYLDPAARDRMKELTDKEWIGIFGKLWKTGVHHITFTGGEPLMRPGMVNLVSEAEEFVTGLVTNGVLLEQYAGDLKNASLDYCQVTIESGIPEHHDAMTCTPGSFQKTVNGIKKALSLGMHVVPNTTLTKTNAADFPLLLDFGKSLGLKSMACNTLICSGQGIRCRDESGLPIEETKDLLKKACEKAVKLGIELQWYSPTCYKKLNPVELGFGVKQCSAACSNMTVQPDRTVLPCQSWKETVGNILTDKWTDIWNHPVCRKLREHKLAPENCGGCEYIAACGGGCPLEKGKGGAL